MVGRKVVRTMEGLHYSDEIWKAMSKEQKAKVAELAGLGLTSFHSASDIPAGF